MLRRGDEHVATQKEFEVEAQAKLDAARQRRQLEREKQEALEVRTFDSHSILSHTYLRSGKKSKNSAVNLKCWRKNAVRQGNKRRNGRGRYSWRARRSASANLREPLKRSRLRGIVETKESRARRRREVEVNSKKPSIRMATMSSSSAMMRSIVNQRRRYGIHILLNANG